MNGLPPSSKRLRRLLPCAVLSLLLAVPPAAAATGDPGAAAAGRPLAEALRELGAEGLTVVFSSSLVPPTLLVDREPEASGPRQRLAALLAPHGLTTVEDRDGQLVVVRAAPGAVRGRLLVEPGHRPLAGARVRIAGSDRTATSDAEGRFAIPEVPAGDRRIEVDGPEGTSRGETTVRVPPGGTAAVELVVRPASVERDSIEVTASYSLSLDGAPGATLDAAEIDALPHFGDDLYRALRVLPGTSGGDISARFNVRGGLYDEVLVRLDGLELFEPFHLKDFQGVFSILDPQVVGSLELITGSYPAELGDRMTAVLDMTTRRPSARQTTLGISLANAWAGTAGTFAGDRGRWLASARRGYLDVVLHFAGQGDPQDRQPDPRYWDAFAKLDYDLPDGSGLSLRSLAAGDSLTFRDESASELTSGRSSYDNAYLWLAHRRALGRHALVESLVSVAHLGRDRNGLHAEAQEDFTVRDARRLTVLEGRQDWSVEVAGTHSLKAGLEARRFAADYAYRNELKVRYPIDDPRFPPKLSTTAFDGDLESRDLALYVADRWRPRGGALALEIGLRHDRQSLTDDTQTSPRLNLAYDLAAAGTLRFGWGLFYQSQRPQELPVEFGERDPRHAEHAEHWTLGYERPLGRRSTARLDLYRRVVRDPLPRYETLFDPFAPFPEARSDRVAIAAERATARGVELSATTRLGRRFEGWAAYTLSEVEDRVGGEAVRRSIDQRHALTWQATYRIGERGSVSAVWTYHSGWPTTAIAAELTIAPDGSPRVVHQVGPFYGERLPPYHRLDVRASRHLPLRHGELTLFVEVQNLYDRDNVRGLAIEDEELVPLPDGRVVLDYPVEHWLGILPSFGISWQR